MRRRPMHNHCLDGYDLKPVLLDLLDMISGRDEIPPDPDEEPLPIFDKDAALAGWMGKSRNKKGSALCNRLARWQVLDIYG